MRILLRVLAVLLVISGLMPLMATLFAATDQSNIMEMFHFTAAPTTELQVTFVMMGSALLFTSVIQFLAATWVWKAKPAGLQLSIVVAIIMLAASSYIFAVLSGLGINDPSLYAVDAVKGVSSLALAGIALKNKASLSPNNP